MEFSTQLSLFSTRFLGIFIEAVSFLLLGTIVSGLIEVFVRKEDIARLLPRNPFAAIVAGSFLGFLFPVCECGVVPVTRKLYQKGLPVAVGVAFLLAAPVMNPIVFASTYAAFGFGPILIGRFVITCIMAVAIGLIFSLQRNPIKMLHPRALMAMAGGSGAAAPQPSAPRLSVGQGIVRAARVATDEFFDMGRYLVMGTALAAGMQTFLSQEQIRALASDPSMSAVAMAIMAFVLSICSTTDAILALSFANFGFPSGSLLTFLTFGPMVDIKATLMYLSVFKRRVVFYMVILPLLMSLLFGIFINLNVRF
ncbi:MAG: permease [Chloroflexi bacterium CFX4]|nr:permease [Chloroflexi bacterium CFX4]MDL1922485.1 permease [Chloroflexi bacterium CFX3]